MFILEFIIFFVESFRFFTCKILSSVSRVLFLPFKLYNFYFILLCLLGPLMQYWIEVMKADILFFWPNLWKEALNFHCNFNISCRFFWWGICYHLSSHTSYQDCQYKCWHSCLRNAGTPEGSFPSSADIGQPPGIYGRHMQRHQWWLLCARSQKTFWYLFVESNHLWSQPEHLSNEQHGLGFLDSWISFRWLRMGYFFLVSPKRATVLDVHFFPQGLGIFFFFFSSC